MTGLTMINMNIVKVLIGHL